MKRVLKSRWIKIGLVVCVLGAGSGVWLLLHPAAFWLKPWRPQAFETQGRFIFGPYPVEPDFVALKKQGVSTIVSLLDPMLPYERVLLDQERERAQRYGMRVLNFPMASILGQSFGKDYVANSKAAAQAALRSRGVVYLHCYLGLHRAANVRKILQEQAQTEAYAGTLESGRSPDVLALDRANIAYLQGNTEQALAALATIQQKTPEATLLEAWAYYRLNRLDEALADFQQVAAARPDLTDAVAGIGFCALRRGDLHVAETQFNRVLAQRPDDPSGLEGLGHVRYQQGRLAEARALFEQIVAKHPENVDVQQLLDRIKASS